jgi:hypothetical protein
MKAVASLRNQFGGHAVEAVEASPAAGPSSGTGDTRTADTRTGELPDESGAASAGPTSGTGDTR